MEELEDILLKFVMIKKIINRNQLILINITSKGSNEQPTEPPQMSTILLIMQQVAI